MGWASGFSAGSQLGRTLVDTYQNSKDYEDKQKKKDEIAAIVAAQQDQQSALTETNAPDAQLLTYDSDTGQYVPSMASVVANQGTATPEAAPQLPTFDAKTTTNFLGKSYDKPLDEAGMNNARQQAMAGVMEKHGDPEAAMRYRQQATQGELQSMQLKQAQRQGLREDKADANTALFEGIDKEVGAADLARRTNADGTTRDMNLDDHLHNSMVRANLLTQKGKINEAGQAIKEYNAQSFAKIQLDTAQRDQDLGRAASALGNGDTSGIKDFYNKHVPDGAHVTNVSDDGKGNLTIERTTIDGRPLAPVTKSRNELLAGLASFKDPMALYNFSQNEFRNNLATRTADRADKSLSIQAGSAAITNQLHGAQIDEIKQKTTDKKDYSDLQKTYGEALDSGDAKAIDAAAKKLHAFNRTGRAGEAQSAYTQKVDLIMRANPGMSMSKATELANQKAQSTPKDDYIKLTTGAMPRSPEDLNRDMAILHGPNWKEKISPSAPPAATFSNQADADAAAKAGKLKAGDRVSIGGRTATWH